MKDAKKIISRKEARQLGLSIYDSDTQCPNNHTGKRYVLSQSCVECSRARGIAWSKKNPLYRLSKNTRLLIYLSFKSKGYTKKSRTYKILGCSFEFFKKHLEKQFKNGMTWENRSEWHIDHIIPLATAKTEEDVIKLNHYTNLQPLWAEENLKKGAKIDYDYS